MPSDNPVWNGPDIQSAYFDLRHALRLGEQKAGILVARHLKTTEDLFDSKSSPRTESLVAAAVQWAERIMRKIDGVYR